MPFVDPTLGGGGTLVRAAWSSDVEVFEDAGCTDPAEDTDAVLCWHEDGGFDTTAQLDGVGSEAPTLTAEDDRNGIAAIVFNDADDDRMVTANLTTLNSYTLAMVCRLPTSPSGTVRTLAVLGTGTNPMRIYLDASDNLVIDNSAAVTHSTTALGDLGLALGDWCLIMILVSGISDNTTVRVNGQPVGKTADLSPLDSPGDIVLGDAAGDGSNSSNVRYQVIAWYQNDLDATDIALLESYLMENWVNIVLGPTPPPALPPLTYLDITGSTDATHSFAGLALLDKPSLGKRSTTGGTDHDTFEEQLRVFRNGIEQNRPGTEDDDGVDISDYSVDEDAKTLTLNVALSSLDRLLIVRQTRRDRPYVEFTRSARLKREPDINLFLNQVLYIVQELQEEPQIQQALDNVSYPDGSDKSDYNVVITGTTGTGPFDYSDISLINDDRVPHQDQLHVFKNESFLTLTDDYTVDAANQEITLVSPLVAEDELEIRRHTSRHRYVPDLPDGSSFSSDTVQLSFTQVQHLIHELPVPIGIENAAIRNYRNPRRKTFVKYSGPGDRFYYGNLPWYPDGSVFVWRDDSLLTEDDDYYNDDWSWIIDLINDLLSGEDIIITVQPGCPFPILFCNGPGHFGPTDPDDPLGPNDPNDPNDPPSGPTQTIPKILVPVTTDSDTASGGSAATLSLDGDALNKSSIFLHWDLTFFANRTATAVTFGLYENSGIDATDTVKIFEATSAGAKVSPENLIDTWDVQDTNPNDSWYVSNDLTTFINTRLADGGNVYLLLEAEGAADQFTVWAKEGQVTASVFGPHMSLEGAAYPSPGGAGGPVGEFQVSVEAEDTGLGAGDSQAYTYDVSASNLLGQLSHLMGGDEQGDETIDPEWHEIQFGYGTTIPNGSTIHSATLTCQMTSVGGGAGSLSQNSLPDTSWVDFAGFLAGLTGPALTGPGGVGVNVIDVTDIIQDQADNGGGSGISIYHYPGASPPAGLSAMLLTGSPNVPTLFIDFDTP